jgi:hypothetical protein
VRWSLKGSAESTCLYKNEYLYADPILGWFKQKREWEREREREEIVMHVLTLILIISYVGTADRGICLQLH